MKKCIMIAFCTLIIFSCGSRHISHQASGEDSTITMNARTDTIISHWYVPSAKVAVQIAEIIWLPIYGNEIYSKQPFNVYLRDSLWVVTGSQPKDMDGGVPYIEINGANGKIYNVYHSK